MVKSSRTYFLSALAVAASATDVLVPIQLPTREFLRDAYAYSLEPVWTEDYISSDLTRNLMNVIANITGKPPAFRIGGNTGDQTYYHPELNISAVALPNTTVTNTFNISDAWFEQWSNYFPKGTEFLYTLNLKDNSSAWENAVQEAAAAYNALGDKLKLFEIGNEIDHFINKGWRPPTWDVAMYIQQWRNISDQIVQSSWFKAAQHPPKFQAAVFADPPWVPDQQDEIDDFDIINLTRAGLTEHDKIGTYAVHLYPQSTCDTERWYRLSLDLLSNHSVLWHNVSQYVPQVAAADKADIPLVFGETNSASCSGRSGISDTFGAALWSVDYVLLAASIGMPKVYFHLGANAEYSSFVPLPYEHKNESLQAGIRSLYYGHYFMAHVLASEKQQRIAQLPTANTSDFSGYAIYSADNRHHEQLNKVVLIDLQVWNGTQGLSNPSTLSTTDSTYHSAGQRPVREVSVTTCWLPGTRLGVIRLQAPGTNAKSQISVSGVSFDPQTGVQIGALKTEEIIVGGDGRVCLKMQAAEAVLLNKK
ncbi:glycoside hydrolase family 79 protein, partial [Aureobasidium melanogenum]